MGRHGLVRWPPWAALAGVALLAHFYELYRPDSPPSAPWLPYSDKFGHVLGFALPLLLVLVTLAVRAQSRGRRLSGTSVVVAAGVFGAHAVISEVIQGVFYRGRAGDPLDVLADAVGVMLGVITFQLLARGAPLSRAPA